jgi:FkbM family methyltransferase
MPIELKQIEGINFHESEYLYDEIFVRETYLRHGLALSADAVVFDVGANIGMFSMFVATKSPAASIYAFEPIYPVFQKLERNLRHVSANAHVFCCALSSAPGQTAFTFYPGYSTMSAQSSYVDAAGDKAIVKSQVLKELQRTKGTREESLEQGLDELLDYQFRETRYQCQVRCISEIVEEHEISRIDFLKIDVQRAEHDVLRGIRESHWPRVQQIAMEVHDKANTPTAGRLETITRELTERGFVIAAEQQGVLIGSDRHNLFARRPRG